MDLHTTSFPMKGALISMEIEMFDGTSVNLDKLLTIDYSDLYSEVANFPAHLQRLSIMYVEAKDRLRDAELDLEIFSSDQRMELRNKLTVVGERGGVKEPTSTVLDEHLTQSPIYLAKRREVNRLRKEEEYLGALFWNARQKMEALTKISLTVNFSEAQ